MFPYTPSVTKSSSDTTNNMTLELAFTTQACNAGEKRCGDECCDPSWEYCTRNSSGDLYCQQR